MSRKIVFDTTSNIKGCCILAAFAFSFSMLFAQTGSSKELLKIISYTTPGFQQSTDSTFNTKLLEKYYSVPNYTYSLGYIDSLNIEEKRFLDSVINYVTKRYIADIAIKHRTNNIAVTDNEVLTFYHVNKHMYATKGQATYLISMILKEEPAVVEKVKEKLIQLAGTPDSLINYRELRTGDYGISIERKIILNDNIPLLHIIKGMKEKQTSDLIQIEGYNSKCIIHVMQKTEASYLPFSEVINDCRSRLIAEKTEIMMQQLIMEAVAKYPIN